MFRIERRIRGNEQPPQDHFSSHRRSCFRRQRRRFENFPPVPTPESVFGTVPRNSIRPTAPTAARAFALISFLVITVGNARPDECERREIEPSRSSSGQYISQDSKKVLFDISFFRLPSDTNGIVDLLPVAPTNGVQYKVRSGQRAEVALRQLLDVHASSLGHAIADVGTSESVHLDAGIGGVRLTGKINDDHGQSTNQDRRKRTAVQLKWKPVSGHRIEVNAFVLSSTNAHDEARVVELRFESAVPGTAVFALAPTMTAGFLPRCSAGESGINAEADLDCRFVMLLGWRRDFLPNAEEADNGDE